MLEYAYPGGKRKKQTKQNKNKKQKTKQQNKNKNKSKNKNRKKSPWMIYYSYLLKIHTHGWSKISMFSHFLYLHYSLIIHQHWFQKHSTSKMLMQVKTMCNLHCWNQLSPIFQNVMPHMNIWPDPWVTSLLEWKRTRKLSRNKILLPNVRVPILAN